MVMMRYLSGVWTWRQVGLNWGVVGMKQGKGGARARSDKRAERRRRLVAIVVGAIALIIALAMILAYIPGIQSCSAQASSSVPVSVVTGC